MDKFEKENIELRKQLREILDVCEGYRKGAEKIREVAKREVLEGLRVWAISNDVGLRTFKGCSIEVDEITGEIDRRLKELEDK